MFSYLFLILLLSFAFSHIRECLKLDQDDKECFSHYKQVKKLSKQLDSAEELIQEERWVPLRDCHTCSSPSTITITITVTTINTLKSLSDKFRQQLEKKLFGKKEEVTLRE